MAIGRIDKPGVFLLYEDKLARVIGIAEGRTIILDLVEEDECPHCHRAPHVELLEHSPLFQENVAPVPTVALV